MLLYFTTVLHYYYAIPTILHQFTQIKSRLQLLQGMRTRSVHMNRIMNKYWQVSLKILYQDLYHWEQGSAETIRKSTSANQQNGYQLSNEVLVITVGNLRCHRMASVQNIFEANITVYPFWSNSYKLWSGLLRGCGTALIGTDIQANLMLNTIIPESEEKMDLSGPWLTESSSREFRKAFCKLWVILTAVICSSNASYLDALVQD